MSALVLDPIRSRPELKARLKKLAALVGYDTTDWVRVVMYQKCFQFLQALGPERLDVMEVSAGPHWVREFNFRSFTGTQYPPFDICAERLPRQFDVIVADQVFEHLKWPLRAARNVFAMLRPGGYFVIATPFLVRVHKSPIDCHRWTEDGLSCLLQEAGFPAESITTDSWGNRACLVANLRAWRKRGFFGSLANEPDFPVMVWAFARKPAEDDRAACTNVAAGDVSA
jgi:SAM-dependent methyltransferase